jgi:hypothetical protein
VRPSKPLMTDCLSLMRLVLCELQDRYPATHNVSTKASPVIHQYSSGYYAQISPRTPQRPTIPMAMIATG